MSDLAEVGNFCPNDSCSDARKTDLGNIIKYGRTAKGLQRYRCKTCGKTFSENTGTIFYGLAYSGQGDHPKEISAGRRREPGLQSLPRERIQGGNDP